MLHFDANTAAPMRPPALAAFIEWNRCLSRRESRQAYEQCVDALRLFLGIPDGVFCFTSGAQENALLALYSAERRDLKPRASMLESPAILAHLSPTDSAVPVTPDGYVDASRFSDVTAKMTYLVFLSIAEPEYGLLQDIRPLAETMKTRNAKTEIFVDAVQAAGRLRISGLPKEADYCSLSAHTFGGPPGLGILWARDASLLDCPLLWTGCDQQESRASVSPALLASTAIAARLAAENLDADVARMAEVRRKLDAGIQELGSLNFQESALLCNTSNYHIPGIDSQAVCLGLDLAGIRVGWTLPELEESTLCSVLTTFSFPENNRYSNIRFSVSPENTPEQADAVVSAVRKAVEVARKL